jgi:hypothetical protein
MVSQELRAKKFRKEQTAMRVLEKAVVILVPTLLFGLGAAAWSASSDDPAALNTPAVAANPASNSLLSILTPVLTGTDPTSRQPKPKCKATEMYSQHDVVGDKEGCFMGRYGAAVGAAPVVSGP